MSVLAIQREIRKKGNKARAKFNLRFFRTGKGEYGEGDQFLGLVVPDCRKIAKKYRDLERINLQKLISSKYHEERLTALFILVDQYRSSKTEKEKKRCYDFYVRNLRYVNNWDLVDTTTPHVIGDYLVGRSKKPLYTWARSKDLWKKRVSILATYAFIRNKDFADTLKISKILLHDDHDLIHKAVGWMLREVGNRNQRVEEVFLKKHAHEMPRTMLRYAIEKFPKSKRVFYMNRL